MNTEKFRKLITETPKGFTPTTGGFDDKGRFCDMNGHPVINNLEELKVIEEEMRRRQRNKPADADTQDHR